MKQSFWNPDRWQGKIRLFAADLDGTLLDSRNRITSRTLEVLGRAGEHGISVVPATGRCCALIPAKLRKLQSVRYAIVSNGAGIWDCHRDRFLYRETMPESCAGEILDWLEGNRGLAEVFVRGEAYADIRSLIGLNEGITDRNFVDYFSENHIFVEKLVKRRDLLEDAEKINLYFLDPDGRKQLEQQLRSDGRLALTSSISGNLEVQASCVNKGTALRYLCRTLEIPLEETAAVGDSDNDLEMLEAAGIGAAMENAGRQVKDGADFIIGHHDRNGAAEFLEDLMKIQENLNNITS